MADRLVVVANRLPLTARRVGDRWLTEPSSGGLVAALAPILERTQGIWIGWPGEAAPEERAGRAALLEAWERERHLVAVDLPADISRPFYEGYSNDTLWPLLHGFPSRTVFSTATWQAYRDANERFAEAVLRRAAMDDLVWVHDYQLALVPGILRRAAPGLRVGFFLHVPFPAPEIFRILPEREQLLEGLLGADLLAFQTHEHLGAFRRSLAQVSGIDSRMDSVDVDGRSVALAAMPIGIAADGWERLVREDRRVGSRVAQLRERYAGRRLILAVDRLDHTKGIPQRLRAYRTLLTRHPEWRGVVELLQIAIPSRERVPSYAALRREVNELVGEMNGAFGTPEWSPVTYLRRPVPRPELAALYAAADVAWVAPLRDGMNLVAKEYVACQGDGSGALVLSEFAGAASELGEAIRVNPYDEVGSAEAVHRALTLPEDERHDRQAALLARVRANGVLGWGERFVRRLGETAEDRREAGPGAPPPPLDDLRRAFRSAGRRALFLDYDGTLVPLASRPAEATPTPAVVDAVAALAGDARTTVVIASGRSGTDLERWFGAVPGLWLAAEHGALLREPGGGWLPLRAGADSAWKDRIRPILDDFAARTPGSLVEEKAYALAWHHRMAEPEFGGWLANELAATLDERLTGTELTVLRGDKVIEVRFAWANKGEAAAHVLALADPPAFVLALGDDRTDEDLFERLPADSWTIRVGGGRTRARYRLAGPAATLGLLAALADPEPMPQEPTPEGPVPAQPVAVTQTRAGGDA